MSLRVKLPTVGKGSPAADLTPAVVRPAPRLAWRDISSASGVTGDESSTQASHTHYRGFGLTLDAVISYELWCLQDGLDRYNDPESLEAESGLTLDDYLGENGDLVIWERGRVLAIIRTLPGHPEPELIRFDGSDARPPAENPWPDRAAYKDGVTILLR